MNPAGHEHDEHPFAPRDRLLDHLTVVGRAGNDRDAPLERVELLHAALPADADHLVVTIQRLLDHVLPELPGGPDDANPHRARPVVSSRIVRFIPSMNVRWMEHEGDTEGRAQMKRLVFTTRRVRAALVVVGLAGACAVLAAAALAASLTFTELPTSPEAGGNVPRGLTAADLDGDGDNDLVVAIQGEDAVRVLLNKGTGDFRASGAGPTAVPDNPQAVAAADLDGDGDKDLAVPSNASGDVTILRNNGNARFAEFPASPEEAGSSPESIVAADLDDDGDQDLAVANFSDDSVTLLRNRGNGNFNEPGTSPVATGSNPESIVAADDDGDGDVDLAVANLNSSDVTLLRNNGVGRFVEPATSPESIGELAVGGSPPSSLVAGDWDGDGDSDLAIATSRDIVEQLRNNGTGNYTHVDDRPPWEGRVGDNPNWIAVADFDLDGDHDLATANLGSSDVSILRNNGLGRFVEPDSSPLTGSLDEPWSIVAADFDGDLDPDLAVSNHGSGQITVLRDN